jgi:hypothetical protein
MSGRTSRPLVPPDGFLGYVDRARSDPPAAFEQHSFEGIIAPTTPNCLVRITVGSPPLGSGTADATSIAPSGMRQGRVLQPAEPTADWRKEPEIHARFTARSPGQEHGEDQ